MKLPFIYAATGLEVSPLARIRKSGAVYRTLEQVGKVSR